MSYQFDDRDIKMQYEENVQRTAPDMEKLWSRIESSIDKTDDAQTTRKIHSSGRTKQTKVLASLAAALVLAAGIGIFTSVRSGTGKNSAAEDNTSVKAASESSISGEGIRSDIAPADNGGTGSYAKPAEEAQNDGAAHYDEDVADTAEELSGGSKNAYSVTNTAGEQKTEEAAAMSAEDRILVRTSLFLDAKVTGMDQINDHCTYTLEVITSYSRDSELKGGTVKLEADIPIGLTVGMEYLIPAFEDGNGLHPVICDQPQIRFSGDGRMIFTAQWETLAKGAEDMDDGFLSAPQERVQEIVAKWRSLK